MAKKRFEKPILEDSVKNALDEEHGDIMVLDGHPDMSPWRIVVRRPTRQESIGYKAAHKKDPTQSAEMLIKRLAVWPDRALVDEAFEAFPFLGDGVLADQAFQDFIGISANALLK